MSETERFFEYNGLKYKVIKPSIDTNSKANAIRARVFNEAFRRKDMTRSELEFELKKRGIWTTELQAKFDTLAVELGQLEEKLTNGGVKLEEAKQIAFEMQDKRYEMVQMLNDKHEMDSNTCEGQADAARFNYLCAMSVYLVDSNSNVFKTVEDFDQCEDTVLKEKIVSEFYYLINNSDDVQNSVTESVFLKEFDFVDEEGKLVDSKGKLIDRLGRHIDDNGYLIKWTGQGKEDFHYINIDGKKVDPPQDHKIKFGTFLDEDGNPIRKKAKKTPKVVQPA